MPKKKHRMSWLYEDVPAVPAPQAPEEDTLALSAVEVAYPPDVLVENAPTEDPPPFEEEEQSQDDVFAEEPPAEEDQVVEGAPFADRPPPAEEVLDEHPPIEEAEADFGPETAQQTIIPSESKSEDSEEDAAGNADKFDDQAGDVVVVCTSCTTMLLIEHDGPCPYSVSSLMDSDPESYSWLLHTTCFSCVNKHKLRWASKDSFSNTCMEAFTAAILSEEFMTRTSWFEVADRVCRKPLRIVMGEGRRSVAYVKIDVLREETTGRCRIRGLKSVASLSENGGRNDLVDSFAPGGFM